MSMHIDLGHALITMVEPEPATVRDYNRWYEHDHFLSGVLAGPGAFAGRRFAAPRSLKELRSPDDSPIANPLGDGSFIAVYWIEHGQLAAHCDWGFPEAARLARLGRMRTDRRHVSTSYYDLVGHTARDQRPVPVELALHHLYPALVMVWTAGSPGEHDDRSVRLRSQLTGEGSPVAQVVTFRPVTLPEPLPAMPGVIVREGDDEPASGGDLRAHCCFLDDPANGSLSERWPDIARRCVTALDEAGLRPLLVAPFVPTVPGTDTYLDELW